MPDAPFLSIVIPVFNVHRYLTECLDSVSSASGTEIEVIAVDDGSTDGSGAVLDEYARADSRLHVIHLDRTGGPGQARNIGLARATGSYVWFVDGDDLIRPEAIGALGTRLRADQP